MSTRSGALMRESVTPIASATPAPISLLQRKRADGGSASGRRECEQSLRNQEGIQHRHASDQAGPTGVPPIVHEVLGSPGQPLDTQTRAFFEPRFGHDFSRVRVHTDGKAARSAAATGSLAYTVGDRLVFGQDQYRPTTGRGRMLVAHELAHTIQQQNQKHGSATGDSALEREADNAVAAAILHRPVTLSHAAAPRIQFLKVTSGALGQALEVFTNQWNVPNRAISLLQRSPSFTKLAAVLDANYVWRGESYKVDPIGERGPDGRLKAGPFKGKRELFDVISGKPSFEPFEAPPEPGRGKISGDSIQIESTDVPGFISEIAHEATHAARFVGTTTAPPANIVAEVNASITDEVETRKSEAKILGEVPAKEVQARVPQVGTRIPAEVERDISPAFGLTYLENAFFATRLREAQATDGITQEDAEKVRAQVEKDFQGKSLPSSKLHFKPRLGTSGLYELSEYGDTWFNRRLAQAEWKEFSGNHASTNPDFAVEKEKLVQDHASRFFEGRILYQALPKQQVTP
jgi:hypothetical protein